MGSSGQRVMGQVGRTFTNNTPCVHHDAVVDLTAGTSGSRTMMAQKRRFCFPFGMRVTQKMTPATRPRIASRSCTKLRTSNARDSEGKAPGRSASTSEPGGIWGQEEGG